jgi:hypothetical protein
MTIEKKIYDRQLDYILTHFERVTVESGKAYFNCQCHQNSVQFAKEQKQDYVVAVFAVNSSNLEIILHFVNENKKTLTDNTLGYRSKEYEYFYIKQIASDFQEVLSVFESVRREMLRILPWYLRNSEHAVV